PRPLCPLFGFTTKLPDSGGRMFMIEHGPWRSRGTGTYQDSASWRPFSFELYRHAGCDGGRRATACRSRSLKSLIRGFVSPDDLRLLRPSSRTLAMARLPLDVPHRSQHFGLVT